MDDNSNNPIIDQLPSQNEVYQNHNNNLNYNNEQTPSNYIPPSIYDNNNNIDQEINNDNNDNNESRLSSLDAPPAYDIYQPSGVQDPLNQDSLNIYNNPPQSIGGKEIFQETNSETVEPVYQLQVDPYKHHNGIIRPCCECCCGDCCCDCDRCSEDCCAECCRCCKNVDWVAVLRAIAIGLAAMARKG